MVSLLGVVLCSSGLPLAQPGPAPSIGVLWQPAFALDTVRRAPSTPYVPQPGDLLLCNSSQVLWRLSYRLALSGPPTHSAVVFRMKDGRIGALETWVDFPWNVEIKPIDERLRRYDGDVYMRTRKKPLSPEASARLTEFAHAVEKKRVAAVRLFGQATPLRARGPFRTAHLGKPHGIREHYICSELVIEAYVYAGMLDAETARPAATQPRDLFFECSANSYLNRHLNPAINADWNPPALWTDEK